MSMKRVYSCDICRDPKQPIELLGFNFSGMTKFKLDNAHSTGGVHACFGCLRQLKDQLSQINLDPDAGGIAQ